jgi:hypothetical protein
MSFAKKALKTAAWVKAPRLMFAKRNPRKAALLAAGSWVAKRVMPGRRRKSSTFGLSAVQGLGAAAVAIPVGLWAGRKVFGGGAPTGAESR